MRFDTLFSDIRLHDLFETALPDFVLAFAFFTSVAYAVLGKRFELQRPAVAMSAVIGFALSAGLIWWEQQTGLSIKNLGPIAIGFAVILLAFVMYQSIRHIGGSWAGAGIALGASILIAKVLGLRLPLDREVVQAVMIVTLIVGIIAFLFHRRHSYRQLQYSRPIAADIRHDMSDLYKDRRLSNRLTKKMHHLRRRTDTLAEHPEETGDVLQQLRWILPAEGWLTQRMAQLRTKAHRIRHGHIARLDETQDAFAKLPASAKKKASAELADAYRRLIGTDSRLERLDKAVAENERRIYQLTRQAQRYTVQSDPHRLHAALRMAEKLQHHNSRLIKIIERTEAKLSRIARQVADRSKHLDKR